MKAFDTDVLNEVLRGVPAFVERAAAIPDDEQAVPVVVIEEILRGRLNAIRLAESGRTKGTLRLAYEFLERTFDDFRETRLLSFTTEAEQQFDAWRRQGIRVATLDMRIGAICVAWDATLITRNRRDFELLPGLKVEFWS